MKDCQGCGINFGRLEKTKHLTYNRAPTGLDFHQFIELLYFYFLLELTRLYNFSSLFVQSNR